MIWNYATITLIVAFTIIIDSLLVMPFVFGTNQSYAMEPDLMTAE